MIMKKNITTAKSLNLSIMERAMLVDMLPAQGNKIQQIICRSLIEKVRFTDEEIKKYNLQFNPGGMSGNELAQKKDASIIIEISDVDAEILKEASSRFDKEGKVNQLNLPLIEKIDQL